MVDWWFTMVYWCLMMDYADLLMLYAGLWWWKNDYLIGGLEHEFYDFPNSWDDDPIWRTHIFQRGRYATNQIWMCSTEILVCNMIWPREIWIKPTKVGNDLKWGMVPSKWGCFPGSSVDLMWSSLICWSYRLKWCKIWRFLWPKWGCIRVSQSLYFSPTGLWWFWVPRCLLSCTSRWVQVSAGKNDALPSRSRDITWF